MKKKVLVFIANGSEEIEAVTVIDILRRAGAEVTVAASGANKSVALAHGITLCADTDTLSVPLVGYDAVFVPGGMPGTLNLAEDENVLKALKATYTDGRLVCAICAAPIILGKAGLLEGKRVTCYPGFEDRLCGGIYTGASLEKCENIITADGPGSAPRFAFEIVGELFGAEKASSLAAAMQYR